jgi:hypothetical protein
MPRNDPKGPTFEEYTAKWWKWCERNHVAGKPARGKRIGRGYVEVCRGYLDRHVMPCLAHLRISEITPKRQSRLSTKSHASVPSSHRRR